MNQKELRDGIDALDWCPGGEAAAMYREFLKAPFYDSNWLLFKLLICLVYEGALEEALQLSGEYICISEGSCGADIFFFRGVAADLLGRREDAVAAYRRVLQYEKIPPSTYDQFSVSVLCRSFVEHLLKTPYSRNCAEEFPFPIKDQGMLCSLEYYEELLREPYGTDRRVRMEYRCDLTDPELKQLRERYRLDEAAGDGSHTERILSLMRFVHDRVTYDGRAGIQTRRSGLAILDLCAGGGSVNCRGVAVTLCEVYLAMGYPARLVMCMPKSETDEDCHAVTSVQCPDSDKWLFMDACYAAYLTDECGALLSIREAREIFAFGKKVLFPPDIRINRSGTGCAWYRRYYLKKNFYRFMTPVVSRAGADEPPREPFAVLAPAGTYIGEKDTYSTDDPDRFWDWD